MQSNCVVYNGSGWLLANCVTRLYNYLCETPSKYSMLHVTYSVTIMHMCATVCESVDGVLCITSQQPSASSDDTSSSTLIIVVIVVIILLVLTAVVIIVLFVIYKKYNGVFMKYLCCCNHVNHGEVLSLQQENQQLRHELSQHKLQLSASPSHNELTRGDRVCTKLSVLVVALGWSRLSGIPDGQGGFLPAIRQSPLEKSLPISAWNDMPSLNKSTSGSTVAPFMASKSPPQSPLFPSRPSLPLVSYYIYNTIMCSLQIGAGQLSLLHTALVSMTYIIWLY